MCSIRRAERVLEQRNIKIIFKLFFYIVFVIWLFIVRSLPFPFDALSSPSSTLFNLREEERFTVDLVFVIV